MARAKEGSALAQTPIATVVEAATATAEAKAAASEMTVSAAATDPEAGNASQPAQGAGASGAGGPAMPELVETRDVTVTGAVKHDGTDYAAGATIALTEAQFEVLRKAGLTVQARWDDCF